MRRLFILSVIIGSFVMMYYTSITAYRVFTSDLAAPAVSESPGDEYRIVLISQELDSPFWTEVERGAFQSAERLGASLEAWGTFGRNERDFLNNIEIAIASKVDGIIVQGLDTDEFTNLTKLKATKSGIPIITVANDVPVNESLRRTYVGSNHYEAGSMIARQLLSDMGFAGDVILMVSDRQEDFQRSRLNGILAVLNNYEEIKTKIVASGDARENVVQVTNQIMNEHPGAKAFIAVTASHASAIIQEIGKRSRVEDYYIYSFDDSPDTLSLLRQGDIDALIAQSPADMGGESVRLMIEWLEGKNLPLNMDGYFTDIRVLKADEQG
jgi:ribose transport system substrate-binding protein